MVSLSNHARPLRQAQGERKKVKSKTLTPQNTESRITNF